MFMGVMLIYMIVSVCAGVVFADKIKKILGFLLFIMCFCIRWLYENTIRVVRRTHKPKSKEFECGMCGSNEIETEEHEYTFPYGIGKKNASIFGDARVFGQVMLSAIVPVRICKSCGYRFLDYEADEKIDKAVLEYLRI
jgi:transcription elongation factor Elf1